MRAIAAPTIAAVTARQLGDLPDMIQPPLLGVVKAASAVSARTLTCRTPAVPRSARCCRLHGRTGAPVPKIAAARTERVRSLDPDIVRVKRKGIAAFGTGKIMVWKTRALCATVRLKQSEVCHEPARCRREQGHGKSVDRLCAAAPAHGRAAAADRGAWRPVLHGVRPGGRCRNRRGAPGRARGDRRGREPARYRDDRQGAAGPDQDQMGPRVPRLRRVHEVHP